MTGPTRGGLRRRRWPPGWPLLQIAARHRVFGAFFLYAFGIGGFYPRLADIQRDMGVAEGAFGLGLAGTATGTLVSLSLAGRLLTHLGHKRALLWVTPLIAVFFAAASWARTPVAMFLLLVPAGLAIGVVEVAASLEADRLEHALGRRIMNRAHAFWSIGFFVAGGVGALLSQAGISVQSHLGLMVPTVLGVGMLLLSGFEPAPARLASETQASAPHFARPSRAILLLFAVTLSAMVLEGAAADWSAIYMRDVFDATPFFSGVAVAAGALMQAALRFFIDPWVERRGPVLVARGLLGLLLVGTTTVVSAASGGVALIGFAMMGAGTSAIFPLAMSAAAQRTDRPAALNIASLAQTSFVAFLAGPPLLGLVAQHVGIRWAFGVCLPLVMLSLATSAALAIRATPAASGALPGQGRCDDQREV